MNNRKVIVFFRKDLAGNIVELVGSDGICPYDNRLSDKTIIDRIVKKDNSFLKNKGAIGFKIARYYIGRDNQYITDLISIIKEYDSSKLHIGEFCDYEIGEMFTYTTKTYRGETKKFKLIGVSHSHLGCDDCPLKNCTCQGIRCNIEKVKD